MSNVRTDDLDVRIAKIEQQISQQLDVILHHPEFQALEARWAGVQMLVSTVPDALVADDAVVAAASSNGEPDKIVVSLWNISKAELREDLEFALSIERSVFYKEIHQESFNTAGGQPFGLLIGDYTFTDHPEDIGLLRAISRVASASFSPFIAAVDPELFGIDRFDQLYRLVQSHSRELLRGRMRTLFGGERYTDWNDLRDTSESRFLGLALPRILMRRPYDFRRSLGNQCRATSDLGLSLLHECSSDHNGENHPHKKASAAGHRRPHASSRQSTGTFSRSRRHGQLIPAPFPYRENVHGHQPESRSSANGSPAVDTTKVDEGQIEKTAPNYLWGNAAFAFGTVVIDSYARSGWLADIHGVPQEPNHAGIVPRSTIDQFATDAPGVTTKMTTEVAISDVIEKELAEVGFLALTHRQHTRHSAFCTTPALHQPAEFAEADRTLSERMASMMHYILCTARFAHFLKKIGHDKIGLPSDAEDISRVLHDFLTEYVLNNDDASPKLKAKRPLRRATVDVSQLPGESGGFHCDIVIQPHHELDAVEIHLSTDMVTTQ